MNKDKIANIVFVLLLMSFIIIIDIKIIKNDTVYNDINNRYSYKLEKFRLQNFIDNTYQDNMEKSISDQMPKYNYFQLFYPKLSNYINYKSSYMFKLNNRNNYTNFKNINLYHNYLLYDSINMNDLKVYDKYIDKINHIINNTKADIYLYYINGDTNINYAASKKVDVDGYLKDKINIEDKYSSLNVDDFDDYKKYYYKLDHHLNNAGSNKVYSDLVNLMRLNDKLQINDTVCFRDKNFMGSKSRSIALNNILSEKVCVDSYDYPKFTIKIDGKDSLYGSDISDLNKLDILSYATIYGGDYGEIVFSNEGANSNRNLLIFSNSYSNSLNKLLASHYKNTYVYDGRYNKNFDMIKYINEKNIDDVLILSNKMLFFDDIKWGDF